MPTCVRAGRSPDPPGGRPQCRGLPQFTGADVSHVLHVQTSLSQMDGRQESQATNAGDYVSPRARQRIFLELIECGVGLGRVRDFTCNLC